VWREAEARRSRRLQTTSATVADMIDTSGIEAKIGRAEEHYSSVVDVINAWQRRSPYRLSFEKDPDGRRRTARLVVKEEVPRDVALSIGDCVHNLRSSLDHLVWAATMARIGIPLRPDRIMFPVYDDADQWMDRASGSVGQLSTELQAAIEELQPFKRPDMQAVNSLRLVSRLDNADKHRMLQPVLAAHHTVGAVVPGRQFELTANLDAPLVDGSAVANLVLDEPDMEAEIDWILAIAPMLEHEPHEGHTFAPVDIVLRRCIDDIREIVHDLVPLT
jgi:hypothetical protein